VTLTRLHHVAAVVADADSALGFWRDTLGLPVAKDRIVEEQGVRGVLLALDNAEIELIQPVTPDSGVARYLADRGEGFHHICFESTDVAADLIAASKAGIKMIDETPREGLAGSIGFLHPRANHGVLIEYAQPPDDEAPRPTSDDPSAPQRVRHAVCAARDLDAATATFCEHFGLHEAERHQSDPFAVVGSFLAFGGEEMSARLEFVTPTTDDPAHPLVERLSKGEGLFRLVLQVPDLAACVAKLEAAGLPSVDHLGDGSVVEVGPEGTNGVRLILAN
jgi:methylmalonyl-CoA/ethylmalonyl-CoA epimerase